MHITKHTTLLTTLGLSTLLVSNQIVQADAVTELRSDRITLINPQDGLSSNFVLIESNGKYGLFDAGTSGFSDREYKIVTDYLKKVGIKKLDFILLSHLDWDHVSTVSTTAGNETRTLFQDFQVDKLYIKEPEDSSGYKIAPFMGQSGPDFYKEQVMRFNDIVSEAKKHGAEINLITKNFDFNFGEFNIATLNTAPAKDDEKQNFWPNLESTVQLVTKKDSAGNAYRMLIANDLEGYDIPETIEEIKALGVTELESYMLNHHGYSQDQKEANDIANTFNIPTTVVTNTEKNMTQAVHLDKYNAIKNLYTNGLYWRGEGSVQLDFSNLDDHGLIIQQEHSINQTQVKKVDGKKITTQLTANQPVTENQLTQESSLLKPIEKPKTESDDPENNIKVDIKVDVKINPKSEQNKTDISETTPETNTSKSKESKPETKIDKPETNIEAKPNTSKSESSVSKPVLDPHNPIISSSSKNNQNTTNTTIPTSSNNTPTKSDKSNTATKNNAILPRTNSKNTTLISTLGLALTLISLSKAKHAKNRD